MMATGASRDGGYLRNENKETRTGEVRQRTAIEDLTLQQLVHLKDSKIQVKVDDGPLWSHLLASGFDSPAPILPILTRMLDSP